MFCGTHAPHHVHTRARTHTTLKNDSLHDFEDILASGNLGNADKLLKENRIAYNPALRSFLLL